MLAEAINQTVGIAAGTLLGALLGLTVRSRQGKPLSFLGGSVILTSIAAAMVAWTVAVVMRLVMG